MKPVVFLDFDGVLNAPSVPFVGSTLHPALRLSIDLVEHLNAIVERTGAHVVLSTSWRPTGDAPPWTLADMGAALAAVGFQGHVVGATLDLGAYLDGPGWLEAPEPAPGLDEAVAAATMRAREIGAWVERHRPAAFVILDDDRGAEIAGHFVHVDSRRGLSAENVETAVRILGSAP